MTINGEPWFVGKDVAEILGYSNSRKAIGDHVDDEDKTDGVTIRDSIGRVQNPIIINESGLYSLILSSKLPTAKQFKRWVTSEVLPAIRKTGGYGVANDRVLAEIAALRAELEATRKTALYAARSVAQPKIKKKPSLRKVAVYHRCFKVRTQRFSFKAGLSQCYSYCFKSILVKKNH